MAAKNRDQRYDQLSELGAKSKRSSVGKLIVTGSGATAQARIRWRVASSKDPFFDLEFSDWLSAPYLYRYFGASVASSYIRIGNRSKHNKLANLRVGFLQYLKATGQEKIRPEQISNSTLNGFVHWMNTTSDLSPNTKRKRYGDARQLLQTCQALFPKQFPSFHINANPWPNAHGATVNKVAIGEQQLRELMRACVAEITEIQNFSYLSFPEDSPEKLRARQLMEGAPQVRGEYGSLQLVVAELACRYGGHIPRVEVVRRDNKRLMEAISKKHGGLRAVERLLYPTTNSMIPFFFFLMCVYAANPETLLDSNFNDFKLEEVLGVPRLRYSPSKNRSRGLVHRSYVINEDRLNPANIIGFLKDWSARLRKDCDPSQMSKVWLVLSRSGSHYDGHEKLEPLCPSAQRHKSTLSLARRTFLKRHNLDENIQFGVIRKSVLEVVDSLFDGDLFAVAAAASHRNLETTHRHYTTEKMKDKGDAKLAMASSVHQRWWKSEGVIDHRNVPSDADVYSATPGWDCADPFSSPQPNSTPGLLCEAFGQCPSCPLAALNMSSEYSALMAHKLLYSILNAEARLSADRWKNIWLPVLDALQRKWIPLLSSLYPNLDTSDVLDGGFPID